MELSGPWIGPLSLRGTALAAALSIALVDLASAALPPTVRVLVDKSRGVARVDGFDLVVSGAEGGAPVMLAHGRAQLRFRCQLNGKIATDKGGAAQLPKAVAGPLRISSLGGFVRVDSKQFRDDLYLYSLHGDCVIINHVDLEKYVAGLLDSEMSAKWNLETLKAQAVAARTYALYQMREASSAAVRQPFDLNSSVKDQVYDGAHKERAKALAAVQGTAGEVLTFKGKPIKAFYHSTCGGKTTNPEKVWGFKAPYMIAVPCGYCHVSPRYRWHYEMRLTDLEKAARVAGLLKGRLTGLRVAGVTPQGRVAAVDLFEGGRSVRVKGTRFREIVGYQALKSTDFALYRQGDALRFTGSGSGHGVGMCQWGAKAMGDRGRAYREILAKYYPRATIRRLY